MTSEAALRRIIKIMSVLLCTALGVLAIFGGLYLKKNSSKDSPKKVSKDSSSKISAITTDADDVTTDAEDSQPQEPAPEPEPEPEPVDPVEARISQMSLHEKVCQLFIVTPEELAGDKSKTLTTAGLETKLALAETPVGGIIYFSDNLQNVDQTEKMLTQTKDFAKELGMPRLFISVDEEGGTVARCAEMLGLTQFADMYYYRDEGEETAYDNAFTIGTYLTELGFDLDFAPVADTWSNYFNTVIGTRAYSDDFEQSARLVASAVKGFKDSGVACTLKHFPGHGDTNDDSHLGSVYSYKSLEELEEQEYLAFESGIAAGADMVMVGHITMEGVDEQPASLSPVMVTEQLRENLGFNGVIITDSLEMGAIADNYPDGEAALLAFKAGCDMLLMPEDLNKAVSSIEKAVESGDIKEERIDESLRRIFALKGLS